MSADVTTLDATAQAQLVRDGELERADLVEAALRQIECHNAELNAVVHLAADEALALVRAVDPDAPLAGVPLLLKDLVARRAGFPATDGSRALADRVARADSELVRRYLAAGLIPIGQTNAAEFGSTPTTESDHFGPARNPWDRTRTAGGSSGGSGAAVAARMVPLAHGNDCGGSIRIPASCCGVFGFKPSLGRTPLEPDVGPLMSRVLSEHVLTRSVRDSALVLDLTSGAAVGALLGAGAPRGGGCVAAVRAPRERLRIAVARTPIVPVDVDDACVAAVDAAAALCERLGHELVEDAPRLDAELMAAWFVLWSDLMGSLAAGTEAATGRPPRPELFDALVWEYYEASRARPLHDHLAAARVVERAARELHEFMAGYDAWLTPTLAQPPLPLGAFGRPDDRLARYLRFSPFTRLANVGGQPAMSLPLHWSADGLPIGVHALGRFGADEVLMGLAAQLEEAAPWADRRPSLDAEARA